MQYSQKQDFESKNMCHQIIQPLSYSKIAQAQSEKYMIYIDD